MTALPLSNIRLNWNSAEYVPSSHLPELGVLHHGGGSTRKGGFADLVITESVRRPRTKKHGYFYSKKDRFGLTAAAVVRLGVPLLMYPTAWFRRSTNGLRAAYVQIEKCLPVG